VFRANAHGDDVSFAAGGHR